MISRDSLSRRSLLAIAASTPILSAARKKVTIGLELFSVRDELKKDLMGTVAAVAKMGYQGVEFFSPYFDWTLDYAKQVRKHLDDLGIKCLSTHNDSRSFTPENIAKAIELNNVLGARFVVMASAGRVQGLDGWRAVADRLNAAVEKMKPAGLAPGYHNHSAEFKELDGKRPLEVLAASTSKEVVLQLDVGTSVEVGYDPVEWIDKNPGRIRSMHLKDYSHKPGEGYEVAFGAGDAPWKRIFQAAEKTGGIEHYLIEQEGQKVPPLQMVATCLANFKKLHG